MNKLPITKQSVATFKCFSKEEPLTVLQIATHLDVFPHSLYRNLEELENLGLVKKMDGHPTRYVSLSLSDAWFSYVDVQRQLFEQLYSEKNNKLDQTIKDKINLTFLKTRSELLKLLETDIKSANQRIEHIVSGLELPAETMLEYKKAVDRKVDLWFIVQNLNELNRGLLFNWQKMGFKVRYYPELEARIIVIDRKVVYFTSYYFQRKEEAIGVRFAYLPIARQMSELFKQRWSVSKLIEY